MTIESENIFDDPELKQALERAVPKVIAPLSLRQSIEQAMSSAAPTQTRPEALPEKRSNRWHILSWLPPHRRLAIAASIAGLGLGIGLFLASDHSAVTPGHSAWTASEPLIIRGALVRHDEMGQSLASGDEQFRRSLYTVPQVREQLRRDAAIDIPQVDLEPAGWKLAGAKPCVMGNCCGAQIFYTRGQQTLSVFVFPPRRFSPEMLADCAGQSGHLAAFRKLPEATLFVVARSSGNQLQQEELEAVATQLAAQP